MGDGADRRHVLTGLAAFGLAGSVTACATTGAAPPALSAPLVTPRALNFTRLEARHGGRLGVFAAVGGQAVAWRGDERFTYCSTFKMFLAAAILERVQQGHEQLDRPIAITAADIIPHAPTTEPAVGRALTIEQLCQATVELSDNPAANILIRELGGLDAFRAWYRAIGDTVTRVDRLEPELNDFAPGDERDTTTPQQAVANLGVVLTGDRLQPPNKAMLERWLFDSPTGPGRIKAGAPTTWRVAHKTGTNRAGLSNDIGAVYPHTGEPIRIAVYFHAPSGVAPAQRDAVIADATLVALAALNHG
jgi:beta-lactamase class A